MAIIYFHMPKIWQTVLYGWIITIKQKVRFQEVCTLKFFFDRLDIG